MNTQDNDYHQRGLIEISQSIVDTTMRAVTIAYTRSQFTAAQYQKPEILKEVIKLLQDEYDTL